MISVISGKTLVFPIRAIPCDFGDFFGVFNLDSIPSCWIVMPYEPSYNPFSLAVLFVSQVGKKVLTFGEVAEVC